jgi:hypothetical protein
VLTANSPGSANSSANADAKPVPTVNFDQDLGVTLIFPHLALTIMHNAVRSSSPSAIRSMTCYTKDSKRSPLLLSRNRSRKLFVQSVCVSRCKYTSELDQGSRRHIDEICSRVPELQEFVLSVLSSHTRTHTDKLRSSYLNPSNSHPITFSALSPAHERHMIAQPFPHCADHAMNPFEDDPIELSIRLDHSLLGLSADINSHRQAAAKYSKRSWETR